MRRRGNISLKLLAKMLVKAGYDHIITVDMHSKESQGFFDCAIDNLRASPFLIQYIQECVSLSCQALISVSLFSSFLFVRRTLRQNGEPQRGRHQAPGPADGQVGAAARYHDGLAPERDPGLLRLPSWQSQSVALFDPVHNDECTWVRIAFSILFDFVQLEHW